MQDINDQLYRPLLSGHQYDQYFPDSKCTVTNLATGNTAVAIKEMAKWAQKYAHQCEKIAPVLAAKSLENTVNNIQDFLFNHIQYSIDGENQNLKSPACAWSTRVEGTDCKSYTIFGSAILLQLGVKHYLRRIKQAVMSDAFTHVYLVIPVNQETGKLTDDYYTIDGTIKYNTELQFTEKDDIYMEPKLAINGLAAGLSSQPTSSCGCGGHNNMMTLGADFSTQNSITPEAISNFYQFIELLQSEGVDEGLLTQAVENMKYFISVGIEPTIEQVFTLHYNGHGLGSTIAPPSNKTLSGLSKITAIVGNLFKKGSFFSNIFGSIDCIGGSAFGGGDLQTALDQQAKFVTDKVEAINKAVFNGNLTLAAKEATEFLAANEVSLKTIVHKLSKGWNSCSTKNMKKFIENLSFYKDYGNKALLAWLNEYFVVSYGANIEFTNRSFPVATYVFNQGGEYSQPSLKLQLKSSATVINGFELNETIINQASQNQFNQQTFLQSLQEIIAIVNDPVSPNPNYGNGQLTDFDNNYGSGLNQNNNDTQAGGGFGMILLAGVVVGGIVYGSKKLKK